MSDARLASCVLKVDDMLRLRHLRVRDVFDMLVSTSEIETLFGPDKKTTDTFEKSGLINGPLGV